MSAQASTSRQPASDANDRLTRSVGDLERQVRELRSQLAKERDVRRRASERSRQKRRASTGSLEELLAAWTGGTASRSEKDVNDLIETRLAKLDDDALTALLTLSTSSLVSLISGGQTTASVLAIPTLLVPTKSVGIEGLGSGGEIDRRLAMVDDDGVVRKRPPPLGIEVAGSRGDDADTPGSDPITAARDRAKQATWMKAWLEGRKQRNDRLLSHLSNFTHLNITSLTEKAIPAPSRSSSDAVVRSVNLSGTLSDLCALTVRYDIHESTLAGQTPQIQKLEVDLPASLRSALSANGHLNRTLRQSNLPALMLSLRTLLPLARLRQGFWRNLSERYSDLVSNPPTGGAWVPPPLGIRVSDSPSKSKRGNKTKVQDSEVLNRLVDPKKAEKLVFTNQRKATLTLTFAISFTRHGHAFPTVRLEPSLPASLSSSESTQTLLETFDERFQHLVAYLTSPSRRADAAVAAAAGDESGDGQDDAIAAKVGLQAAVVAVVDAFFAVT